MKWFEYVEKITHISYLGILGYYASQRRRPSLLMFITFCAKLGKRKRAISACMVRGEVMGKSSKLADVSPDGLLFQKSVRIIWFISGYFVVNIWLVMVNNWIDRWVVVVSEYDWLRKCHHQQRSKEHQKRALSSRKDPDSSLDVVELPMPTQRAKLPGGRWIWPADCSARSWSVVRPSAPRSWENPPCLLLVPELEITRSYGKPLYDFVVGKSCIKYISMYIYLHMYIYIYICISTCTVIHFDLAMLDFSW